MKTIKFDELKDVIIEASINIKSDIYCNSCQFLHADTEYSKCHLFDTILIDAHYNGFRCDECKNIFM